MTSDIVNRMELKSLSVVSGLYDRIRMSKIGAPFFDKRFIRYTWVGVVISVFNVAFLWVLIDLLHVRTVVAGIIMTAATFIIRYILLLTLKVM